MSYYYKNMSITFQMYKKIYKIRVILTIITYNFKLIHKNSEKIASAVVPPSLLLQLKNQFQKYFQTPIVVCSNSKNVSLVFCIALSCVGIFGKNLVFSVKETFYWSHRLSFNFCPYLFHCLSLFQRCFFHFSVRL